ncbi:S8 family serine peptidase [Streptomyces sp. DSM 3412]|uniref:S8 family serine peptidase n=1 Tax=Streptomyces gottesmaniae TaxID=3075518 RepID=A0ABU2ZAB4_9ACTN|nr:S8 family serine peptidase [Streptomyces sp. DSM 3412]MDT0573536.1 S8 family serine peptidase [Streptomyces sp. DSM 3412]
MSGTTIRRTGVITATAALLLATATMGSASAAETIPRSWEHQALKLDAAQRLAQGEGITVAVLDTGVEADHPALKGRVTTGPDYIGEGSDSEEADNEGRHGTAMASDVLKVAPKAKILSLRVTDGSGEPGYSEGGDPVAQGINYAIEHDADVISMSIGDQLLGNSYDEDVTDALGRAALAGVPVLASAGNSGDLFNDAQYPAGYPGVIAVAALQQDGTRAAFSTVRTYNAVAAPGVDIMSASNSGGYATIDGTSPATALASGVVALMLSRNDKLTPAQVRTILTTTAGHAAQGHSPLDGYGVIDAPAAIEASGKPPADRTEPVAYKGEEHLAAPDGTSKTKHPELETDLVAIGGGAAAVGLLMAVGAVFLGRAGRRRTARVAGGAGAR